MSATVAPCSRCEGCGQIANTPDGEPWTAWAALSPGLAAVVRAGIVQAIPCPACTALIADAPDLARDVLALTRERDELRAAARALVDAVNASLAACTEPHLRAAAAAHVALSALLVAGGAR